MMEQDMERTPYRPLILFTALSSSIIWISLMVSGFGILANFFFIMVVSTTVIPVPTPPIILYTGMFYPAIVVGLIGGVASSLGCLLDYIIIGRASETKYLSKYKNNEFMRKVKRYFKANGFLTLMFFAFTPFPFEPVKLLAIASGYNVKLYAIAISFSRGVRYYILASIGTFLSLNQIIAITILFIFLGILKWKFL